MLKKGVISANGVQELLYERNPGTCVNPDDAEQPVLVVDEPLIATFTQQAQATIASLARGHVVSYLEVGDSLTAGPANGGYGDSPGGTREPLDMFLREVRGDFRQIGSLVILPVPTRQTGPKVLTRTCTEAHSGFTQAQLATGVPAWALVSGQADVWRDLSGTNDAVNGNTSAQMIADKINLIKVLQQTHPGAKGIVSSIPLVSPPAANSVAISAEIATFNAALPGICASMGCTFVDAFPSSGAGGQVGSYTDGIHRNDYASAYAARIYFESLEQLFPVRRSLPAPRTRRPREQIALSGTATDTSVSSAATDAIRWPNAPNLDPGPGSFGFGVWFEMASVPPASLRSLLALGTGLQVGVFLNGQTIRLYLNGAQVASFLIPSSVLNPEQEHRLVVWKDAVAGAYLVFLDGILRGTFTSNYSPPNGLDWYVGAEPVVQSGVIGAYKAFFVASGPSVQLMHSAQNGYTLEEAVESDFYDSSMLFSGVTFASEMNDGVGNGVSPDRGYGAAPVGLRENVNTGVLGGGWSWVQSRWQWLRSYDPRADVRGIFQLNGVAAVTVSCPGMVAGIGDEAGLSLVRIIDASPSFPPLVSAGADQFTATGTAGDTSTYAFRWNPTRI